MADKRAITGLAVLLAAASAPAAQAAATGLLSVSAVVESRCRVRLPAAEAAQARRLGHDVSCDAPQAYATWLASQTPGKAQADRAHGPNPIAVSPAPDTLVIAF